MTGPKENSEFCFPRLSMFPEAQPKETLKSRGNKTQCFPRASHYMFCYTSQLEHGKDLQRHRLLDAGWLTNFQRFQGAQPNQVQAESSRCCFRRELVSFDQRYVKGSRPIGKCIWVERYNKTLWYRREQFSIGHFPIYLVPLFQTESSWKTFRIKWTCRRNSFSWVVRQMTTRKWLSVVKLANHLPITQKGTDNRVNQSHLKVILTITAKILAC